MYCTNFYKERKLGFGVSRIWGLANPSYWVLGFTFKFYRFLGFEMCQGLQVVPFFKPRFRVFKSKIRILPGF